MEKIKIRKSKDGLTYCPTCGHELCWDSSESCADRDLVPEDDNSSINYYSCLWCGCSIEQIEAFDEEKDKYPFWNEKLKEEYEEI